MLVEPEQSLPGAAEFQNLIEDQGDGLLHAAIRVLLVAIIGLHEANRRADDEFAAPGFLITGGQRTLSQHWAFMFWYSQFLRELPDVATWSEAEPGSQLVMAPPFGWSWELPWPAILAAGIARKVGYRWTIVLMCLGVPGPRISYFCNGEIHVNELGKPEGKPLTTGHMDFKPSWSKTGDMLVCFRRTKDDPVTVNWKSAIFIINVDGTGFHQLSDGTHTDFNPTWTRDGLNTPIWNRKNAQDGRLLRDAEQDGRGPGEEVALTDEGFHTWAHSCLTDGRILVNSYHPKLGLGRVS